MTRQLQDPLTVSLASLGLSHQTTRLNLRALLLCLKTLNLLPRILQGDMLLAHVDLELIKELVCVPNVTESLRL